MTQKDTKSLLAAVRRPIVLGNALVAVFVVVVVIWGNAAPIAQAVIAFGVINPAAPKHTVQHVSGGAVKQLLVSDGDRVERGAPLLVLDDEDLAAQQAALEGQLIRHQAERAAANAHVADQRALEFPAALETRAKAAGLSDLLTLHRQRYRSERTKRAVARAELELRVRGLKDMIPGLETRLRLLERDAQITTSRNARMQKLYARNHVARRDAEATQRDHHRALEKHAALKSEHALRTAELAEAESKRANLSTNLRVDNLTQSLELDRRIADLADRLALLTLKRRQTVIRAPASGRIVDLAITTPETTIAAGEAIMEIVPEGSEIVVDVRINPNDVERVEIGAAVQILLSSLPQRNLPRIEGTVLSLSADRLADTPRTDPYYSARIAFDKSSLKRAMAKLEKQVKLIAGMPAEVMIISGEQTLMEYIINPLRQTLLYAFRE